MNQLRLRTEFSFGECFGGVPRTLSAIASTAKVAACTDTTTYAHISFLKECEKLGIKGILGYETRLNGHPVYIYARDSLETFYNVTSFCAQNELTEDDVEDFAQYLNVAISTYPNKQWAINAGIYIMVGPECKKNANLKGAKLIRVSDNRYPTIEDQTFAELHGVRLNITAQHIITNQWDHQAICEYDDDIKFYDDEFVSRCEDLKMVRAENIHHPMDIELKCREGIIKRGMTDKWTDEYELRLQRELATIKEKGFEDYFACVSAMMDYAKTKMLVGPARGSAAGSLVCWLMNITEIDPIPFDLLFERFIDETRHDFPDIDSDFQDSKRHLVIEYFKNTYGQENVAQIGTINRYKAKSALSEVAKRTNVPASEVEDVKKSLIVRSGGDARAAMCFYDTVTTLDSGKALLAKYPNLIHAAQLENHARHSGKHAAGVLVANIPMKNYATIDAQGIAQVDKYDCERINLMKIDVLGLKTLSVLADAMGDTPIELSSIVLDDKNVFDVFNQGQYSGIFQFEGQAVQSLCNQIGVQSFEDIVSITSLGRPGPLVSGGAAKFIARKRGEQPIELIHPIYDEITKHTYGLVLYQEQVMSILKQVGQMEWSDVQILRRAMSKSLGLEFFEKFYDRFLKGALANGMTEQATRNCWELLITFGSYGFNRSHAVAYALISYYCAYFKAYHTVEYACASLNHQENEQKIIVTLRELVKEGMIEYVPFDKDHSINRWNHVGNKLIGPLTAVKGIGDKKAEAIIARRAAGKLTASDLKLLNSNIIKASELFEIETGFGHIYENPEEHDVIGPVYRMSEFPEDHVGIVTVIGKMTQKNLRDLNENIFLSKRDGQIIRVNSAFINFRFEDDTDKVLATIGRHDMERLSKEIIDAPLGSIWIIKGRMRGRMKKIYISRLKRLK